METIAIAIFGFLITSLFGLIAYVWKNNENKVKEICSEVKKIDGKQDEIKDNYLHRFDDLKKDITNIMVGIAELKTDISHIKDEL